MRKLVESEWVLEFRKVLANPPFHLVLGGIAYQGDEVAAVAKHVFPLGRYIYYKDCLYMVYQEINDNEVFPYRDSGVVNLSLQVIPKSTYEYTVVRWLFKQLMSRL